MDIVKLGFGAGKLGGLVPASSGPARANRSRTMKTLLRLFGWPMVLTASLLAQPAAKDYTKETAAERDARMGWFRDARFGMFIHWGVYSVPAGEWEGKKNYGEWFLEETKMPVSQYEKFAGQFNPVKFDATAWVRMAKEAGMRYMVIDPHRDAGAFAGAQQLGGQRAAAAPNAVPIDASRLQPGEGDLVLHSRKSRPRGPLACLGQPVIDPAVQRHARAPDDGGPVGEMPHHDVRAARQQTRWLECCQDRHGACDRARGVADHYVVLAPDVR